MKNEMGLSLVEIVIALGILGIIAIIFLSSMSSSSIATFVADERTTAESLARTEMEYIKTESYQTGAPWTYELPATPPSWDVSHALPSGYAGYSVNVTATLPPTHFYDQGIQVVTVSVYHDDPVNPVVVLEGFKANR